jgi:hypothetical protein
LSPQVVLDGHAAELLGKGGDLFVVQIPDFGEFVDAELCHQTLGNDWTDAVEGCQCSRDELFVVEVNAEEDGLSCLSRG